MNRKSTLLALFGFLLAGCAHETTSPTRRTTASYRPVPPASLQDVCEGKSILVRKYLEPYEDRFYLTVDSNEDKQRIFWYGSDTNMLAQETDQDGQALPGRAMIVYGQPTQLQIDGQKIALKCREPSAGEK